MFIRDIKIQIQKKYFVTEKMNLSEVKFDSE